MSLAWLAVQFQFEQKPTADDGINPFHAEANTMKPFTYCSAPQFGDLRQMFGQPRFDGPTSAVGGMDTSSGARANKKRGRDWDGGGADGDSTGRSLPRKEARYREGDDAPKTRAVRFSAEEPMIHYFEANHDAPSMDLDDGSEQPYSQRTSENNTSRLTEELTVLSTSHGRARRELRDITKHDLQTAIKHGTKTRAKTVRGEKRWKFEYGGIVYITDSACTKEITSYWREVQIQPANITVKMEEEHRAAVKTLREDPHLVTTHSIIVVDQSGSMRESDVKGFTSRSRAAYGTLALDYIAEQLYQRGDDYLIDAVTIIEMNDTGTILFDRVPLDWILFNELLKRQGRSKPRSHGNYNKSLQLAQKVINDEIALLNELEEDDLPAFMLVLLSDGKPSDMKKGEPKERRDMLTEMARTLKSKLTVFGMGIGALGSEFKELNELVVTAKEHGATDSNFIHAGLSTASMGEGLSSMATSMTTTRTALLTVSNAKPKTEKSYTLSKHKLSKDREQRVVTRKVSRWRYDRDQEKKKGDPWAQQKMKDHDAKGFTVEVHPFARGAERLAYRFHEIKKDGNQMKRAGRMMVAKESRYIEDEGDKETFHEQFCRAQLKALKLSEIFNSAVRKAPMLQPTVDEIAKPPRLTFLKCRVYEYCDDEDNVCGLLVEDFLMGKFTKFNCNNGYVMKKKKYSETRTMDLEIGEVALTDFVQAFSHWVYHTSDHKMLVCDLQGILNEGMEYVMYLPIAIAVPFPFILASNQCIVDTSDALYFHNRGKISQVSADRPRHLYQVQKEEQIWKDRHRPERHQKILPEPCL